MKDIGSIFKRSLIFCISVIAIAGIFWSCSEDDDIKQAPTISALSPAEAMAGDEVIIIGEHFSHTPSLNYVSFNGAPATVTEAIPIQLTTIVPHGATIGAGDLTVRANGQVSNSISFNVIETPAPTITDVSTDIGIAGDVITITGTYFGIPYADKTVSFNGTTATITESTTTSITTTVPVGATTGELTVTVDGKISNSLVFAYGIKVLLANGGDDAEEYTYDAGEVDTGSSDLELCTEDVDEQNTIGLIFRDIQIPASATIDSAYIQFTCDDDDNQEGPLPIDIHGFAEANTSAPFSEAIPFDISARANTTATVLWQAPIWAVKEEKGPDQATPNLKTIVQEIIGLPGWAAGNNIGFKFTNDETAKIHREAEAWEDNDGPPTELIVIFTVQ